ncbi:Holliday junction branch migration protein RuvA [Anaerocaecibacter muris]|uniref:Holliday junction branch migration protein RuvA n=1 Tax=Anaerocaecibacter muris TaxID=2941513 RepID=UPI003F68F6DC
MFDYISGKVAAVGENRVVIDCGGVGFALTASAFTCADCSRKTEVKMPAYLAVREDALELYGFASERERDLFLMLINVSGVGPKLAVAVLSGMSQDRLTAAIAAGDVAALSSIKGVGKKTAERIALELKSKIADVFGAAVGGDVGQAIQLADEDAVLALVSLGYERKEAEAAVRKVAKPDMTTEQLIRAVLRG